MAASLFQPSLASNFSFPYGHSPTDPDKDKPQWPDIWEMGNYLPPYNIPADMRDCTWAISSMPHGNEPLDLHIDAQNGENWIYRGYIRKIK